MLFFANRFERFIGTCSSRFVDRVNHIDVGILLEKVFHRLTAAFRITIRIVMTDNALVIFIANHIRIFDVDAEALHEALVTQHVNGHLLGVDVKETNTSVFRFVAELGFRIGTNQEASLEIVGGKGGVSCFNRLKRRIESDHEDARVTCLFDCRYNRFCV